MISIFTSYEAIFWPLKIAICGKTYQMPEIPIPFLDKPYSMYYIRKHFIWIFPSTFVILTSLQNVRVGGQSPPSIFIHISI